MKSRSDDQLAGESGGDMSDCKPKLYQHAGNNMDEDSLLINPCGLTAWSLFNDTFKVIIPGLTRSGDSCVQIRKDSQLLEMSEEGIAWESDIKHLFGDHEPQNFNNEPQFRGGGQINGTPIPSTNSLIHILGKVNEDEHFIVWMRNAWLTKFRKLYGIIDEPLSEGDVLTITIENLYNTYLFGGKKRIILSTTSWMGSRNLFIGYVFIVSGCVCLLMAVVYLILHIQFPRELGDERFLSWKRKNW